MEGICCLCNESKELTFEHVPPKAAFNNEPVFIQKHEHLNEENSPLFGKRERSNRGFGGHTFCKECNNKTGAWYAKDFAAFAHQGMEILNEVLVTKQPRYFVKGVYKIKPLNVLKQILVMFMSADKAGSLRSQKDLINFIVNQKSQSLSKRFKVFLYSNHSVNFRMAGLSVSAFGDLSKPQKWVEINFKPFGYLLADESDPAHKDMVDVTFFKDYKYNEEAIINLSTPYLKIVGPFVGFYST